MRFSVFISVLLLVACGQSKKSSSSAASSKGQSDVESASIRISTTESRGNSDVFYRAAPQPILLGPESIQQVYTKVFGPQMLTQSQVDALGGYRIVTASSPSGYAAQKPAMTWMRELSSSYVFELRKLAAAGCLKLVDAELLRRADPTNRLVEGEIPSAERVNNFLSVLLGYRKKDSVHAGVLNYIEAHRKVIEEGRRRAGSTTTAPTVYVKTAYNHLCVALATDVRVYTR